MNAEKLIASIRRAVDDGGNPILEGLGESGAVLIRVRPSSTPANLSEWRRYRSRMKDRRRVLAFYQRFLEKKPFLYMKQPYAVMPQHPFAPNL